jgi:hypothetical protein
MKVNPSEPTSITVTPSEDKGYACALLLVNEYLDATLRLTPEQVNALIAQLQPYAAYST